MGLRRIHEAVWVEEKWRDIIINYRMAPSDILGFAQKMQRKEAACFCSSAVQGQRSGRGCTDCNAYWVQLQQQSGNSVYSLHYPVSFRLAAVSCRRSNYF